jgi:pimeloyl-ACP methyl ester carboxylesterase
MVEVKRHFVDGRYGQVHVRQARPDTPIQRPLVCLHMSPKSGWLFGRFMQQMAEDRIVIAPDYPGFGESDSPPADPPVRIEDYATAMWDVVDALDLSEVDLTGYHTGAMVAPEMARQRPEQVHRIVAIGAPVITDDELAAFHATYETIPLDAAGTRFLRMWQAVQQHAGPGMTLELMAESFAENLRAGEAYECGHRAAFEYAPRYPETLKALPHRIAVINPDDDLSVQSLRAPPYLNNGAIIPHPEWGHGFLDTDTGRAVAEYRRLLDTDWR